MSLSEVRKPNFYVIRLMSVYCSLQKFIGSNTVYDVSDYFMIGAHHSANFSIALVCVIWTTDASCNMDRFILHTGWFILHVYCFKRNFTATQSRPTE